MGHKDKFSQEKIPLPPCEGCACGAMGTLALYEEKWWCPECFFTGPGRHWPKPKIWPPLRRGKDEMAVQQVATLPRPAGTGRASSILAPSAKPIPVPLDEYHLEWADDVGLRRNDSAIKKGLRDQHGASFTPEKRLLVHRIGARGELAASLVFGLPWPAYVDTFRKKPDIEPDIEVKTRTESDFELIIRKNDALDRRFVLVHSLQGKLFVMGWIVGVAVLDHPEWKATHGGREEAWFVPNSCLNQAPPFRYVGLEDEPRTAFIERWRAAQWWELDSKSSTGLA